MWQWLKDQFQYVLDKVKDVLSWIAEEIIKALLYVFHKILDGCVAVLQAIPVPDWFANAGDAFGSIPAGVMFFADFAQLSYGLSVVMAAYVIRFFIRRIPVIG